MVSFVIFVYLLVIYFVVRYCIWFGGVLLKIILFMFRIFRFGYFKNS